MRKIVVWWGLIGTPKYKKHRSGGRLARHCGKPAMDGGRDARRYGYAT